MTLMNDRPSCSIRTARRSLRIAKEEQFSIVKVYNGDFTRVLAFSALLKIIISPLSGTAMYIGGHHAPYTITESQIVRCLFLQECPSELEVDDASHLLLRLELALSSLRILLYQSGFEPRR